MTEADDGFWTPIASSATDDSDTSDPGTSCSFGQRLNRTRFGEIAGGRDGAVGLNGKGSDRRMDGR